MSVSGPLNAFIVECLYLFLQPFSPDKENDVTAGNLLSFLFR